MLESKRSRAHISRAAIERLYIEMRHLLARGRYKPLGRSGEAMRKALHVLNPEIYGSITDPEKVELDGLLYVFQRLPKGIEECRYIKLISREGLTEAGFSPLIPSKRRRNCYRIDEEQMYIEMTRGRSDVYDILTHLTFLYNEAEKIGRHCLNNRSEANRAWAMLKDIIKKRRKDDEYDHQIALTYISTLLGRTYKEALEAYHKFEDTNGVSNLFEVVYWMGMLSIEETLEKKDREISFSSQLVEILGHHVYGEQWATSIKKYLIDNELYSKNIHVISANLHSVMNTLYAYPSLQDDTLDIDIFSLAEQLSQPAYQATQKKTKAYALSHGMVEINDQSGTNITVQIFDCSQLNKSKLIPALQTKNSLKNTVIIVMDYAFGEQAYETMDELLKPYDLNGKKLPINIQSVNIMGKAGTLQGKKGDIMIATAHVMEGMADNYPFENQLSVNDFSDYDLSVYEGNMITVMGTSLQNQDILKYFHHSSWSAIGLEMEGAHYQKAIQANSKIRQSVTPHVKVRYAYYASDNPLISGATLASGSLGSDGVKPTYAITLEILKGIFNH